MKILNILTSSAVHKKLVSFFAKAAVPFKGAEFFSLSSTELFVCDRREKERSSQLETPGSTV
jgi:hypothetical protein